MSSAHLIVHSFILLFLSKGTLATGILSIETNEPRNVSSNEILPKIQLNATVIKDNALNITRGTQHPHTNHDLYTPSINVSSSLLMSTGNKETSNFSKDGTTEKKQYSTFTTTTNQTPNNFTTVMPSHPKSHSRNSAILEYILIPLGCIGFIIIVLFVIRHLQRVKRKRRLERELIHQYSYPNSEAGDDDDQRFLEVESVINTQFNVYSDQEDKNLIDDVPQVSVLIGEGSKLVMQETPSSHDEASTSFNC